MKTAYRLLVSSMILVLCLNISFAQDDEPPYPPITPENAQHLEMIQVLSKGTPRNFSWSPDGSQLAITAEGGTWIYDMTREDMPSYWVKNHDFSPRIVYAPKHNIYVSFDSVYDCPWGDCPYGQKIFVRDATTNEVLHEIGDAYSTIVEFSPDGKFLAVATYFGDIRIWQTATFLTHKTGNPDDFMQCHISVNSSPIDIIFSPDSSWVTYTGFNPAMASPDDPILWIWDTQTCELKLQKAIYETNNFVTPNYASFIANSSDGRYLLIPYFSEDESKWYVDLWDVFSWEKILTIPDTKYTHYSSFTPDNQNIILLDEGIIKIWNIETRSITQEYVADNVSYSDYNDKFTLTTTQLNNGSLLITRGNRFYRITKINESPFTEYDIPIEHTSEYIIGLNDDNLLGTDNRRFYRTQRIEEIEFPEYQYPIDRFKISSDSKWMISSHVITNELIVWDLEQGTIAKSLKGLGFDRITSFSPDNNRLIIGTEHPDKALMIDLETLQEYEFSNFQEVGERLYWSQSDNILVAYTHNNASVDVWSYDTGTDFQHKWNRFFGENSIKAITDEFIILHIDNMLEFLDIQTGELISTISISSCVDLPTQPFCEKLIQATPLSNNNYSDPSVALGGGLLHILDPLTGSVIKSYPIPNEYNIQEYGLSWRFDHNGDLLIATRSLLYNLSQNILVTRMSPLHTPKNTWISSDSNFLLSREQDYRGNVPSWVEQDAVRLWDIIRNREVYHFYINNENSIAFTPDFSWLFVFQSDSYIGGGQIMFDRRLDIFNGLTGDYITSLITYNDNAYDAQFSPDNRFLITSSDTLRVWAVVEP
ncbi:MAG: WD40 repeat domain-containing protein [bacterium]|nr:WD40 repeat domain-containing protein [bacterium]